MTLLGSVRQYQSINHPDVLVNSTWGLEYAGSSWNKLGRFNEKSGQETITRTSQVTLHSVVLKGGYKYALNNMDNDMINFLCNIAVNGSTAEDLPQDYTIFEVDKKSILQSEG
ncbi:hypothetical protein MGYG_04629 [Nannizzia gypsea CBS 118893]|uniref:Uncharacterized protein n=1 Tax=Arthroderma gypseum (strain ATCC MYA-4604 / CBS 118893) TaxID=535722 RepID=E4UU36_ARTGP|nr:hypothetical protein MGYG_04629 [Nannizzia gypsea CBS 118893]EFR01626.1 hypothetical protein MGYG_04629 [Nannizzia gypsea CBS 118893]